MNYIIFPLSLHRICISYVRRNSTASEKCSGYNHFALKYQDFVKNYYLYISQYSRTLSNTQVEVEISK